MFYWSMEDESRQPDKSTNRRYLSIASILGFGMHQIRNSIRAVLVMYI